MASRETLELKFEQTVVKELEESKKNLVSLLNLLKRDL